MSIVIENLSKSYGPVRALQNVSCTWEPGKLYGLLGRNGAGKSTLLSAVTQRLFPDGGSVTVDGEPIGDNDRALSKMYLMSEKLYYPNRYTYRRTPSAGAGLLPQLDREFAWNLAGAFQLNTSAKVSKLSTGYSSTLRLWWPSPPTPPTCCWMSPCWAWTPTTGTCSTRRCWPGTRSAPSPR